jgi:cytochrome c-type biogenesis protein CcmH
MWRLLAALGLLLMLGGLALPASADDPTRQALALYRELKCPVCETSLEASDSTLANQMKDVIREKLAAGESPEQVRAYFLERYGEAILVAPPKSGGSLAAWVMPAVGLLVGAGIVAAALHRFARRHHARPEPAAEPAGDDPYRQLLERELRDLA